MGSTILQSNEVLGLVSRRTAELCRLVKLGIDCQYRCDNVRHMNSFHHNARISTHAIEQAREKGWTLRQVWAAHIDPDVRYPSGRYPGQYRHIRGNLVVIVDEARNMAVTVYLNVEETALRPDQIAKGERIAS